MAMKSKKKKNLIKEHQTHEKDTGSPQVQIALLSVRIDQLTKHLQEHKKDHSGRRGLLGMVAKRRKLLNYLKMNKPADYELVLEAVGLKK